MWVCSLLALCSACSDCDRPARYYKRGLLMLRFARAATLRAGATRLPGSLHTCPVRCRPLPLFFASVNTDLALTDNSPDTMANTLRAVTDSLSRPALFAAVRASSPFPSLDRVAGLVDGSSPQSSGCITRFILLSDAIQLGTHGSTTKSWTTGYILPGVSRVCRRLQATPAEW